jgi:hypothetical protein
MARLNATHLVMRCRAHCVPLRCSHSTQQPVAASSRQSFPKTICAITQSFKVDPSLRRLQPVTTTKTNKQHRKAILRDEESNASQYQHVTLSLPSPCRQSRRSSRSTTENPCRRSHCFSVRGVLSVVFQNFRVVLKPSEKKCHRKAAQRYETSYIVRTVAVYALRWWLFALTFMDKRGRFNWYSVGEVRARELMIHVQGR